MHMRRASINKTLLFHIIHVGTITKKMKKPLIFCLKWEDSNANTIISGLMIVQAMDHLYSSLTDFSTLSATSTMSLKQ